MTVANHFSIFDAQSQINALPIEDMHQVIDVYPGRSICIDAVLTFDELFQIVEILKKVTL